MTSTRIPSLGPRGEGWVLLQGVLFVVIAAAGVNQAQRQPPTLGLLSIAGGILIVAGGVLAVSAARDLGASFSPLPRPGQANQLVEKGAYRLIRHPIYTGILLVGLGWGLLTGSWPAIAATALLLVVFDAKARREEAWLSEMHPDYADYRRRTHRFVPWLY